MALGFTAVNLYDSGASHGTGSFVTSAFTPASNCLLVVCLGQIDGTPANLTISGGGWTYNNRVSAGNAAGSMTIWTAPVGTGVSMQLTFDCGADSVYRYMAHVFTLTGYDTGAPTGGIASNTVGGTPTNFTLSLTPAATSYVIAAAFSDGPAGGITAGTGWVGDFDSDPDVHTASQHRTGSTSTTVTWNVLTGSGPSLGTAALEIKASATVDGVGSAAGTATAAATGSAISVMTPDADITDGGWLTDTGGTSLFAAIDETPASDTDYIVSSDTDTDTCEIRLSDPSATLARPFSVAYRYKRIGSDTPTLRVQLMEGATSRASWDVAVSIDSFTDAEQFLTAPEFAAITDFTDLRVRFTAIRAAEDALTLEGDFSGDLTLEGDFSGSLLLEGT